MKENRAAERPIAERPGTEPARETRESREEKTISVSGILIEICSVLLMFGGVIAGIVMLIKELTMVGLPVLLGSLMLGLMIFGFGKIVCLLTSINAKLK